MAVFFRLLSAWVVNKLIAMYIGPQGTGLVEQFRNFIQSIQGFSGLGIQQGVVRYTAEYQSREKKLFSFLNSSIRLIFIWSFFLGIIIYVFSSYFNQFLFPQSDYEYFIKISGLLLPLFAFNLIFNAFLKGIQAYKTITFLQVFSNISIAVIAFLLIKKWHIYGAFALVILTDVILFVGSLYILFKKKYFKNFNYSAFHLNHFKRLMPYVLMALITALLTPFFNILIRNHIFHYFGDQGEVYAGYWDATKKITNLYLSLIVPVFAMYYYPQLAKIKTSNEFRKEIFKFINQIMPVFIIGLIMIYFLKIFLIRLFFSKDYLPMQSLFLWQILGDFFKILSLLFAYMMLAKTHIKLYIFSEIGFWVLYYFLTLWLINIYQLQGVVMAYFVSYAIYFLFVFGIYGKYLLKRNIFIK